MFRLVARQFRIEMHRPGFASVGSIKQFDIEHRRHSTAWSILGSTGDLNRLCASTDIAPTIESPLSTISYLGETYFGDAIKKSAVGIAE
jgi:hypothetical protein